MSGANTLLKGGKRKSKKNFYVSLVLQSICQSLEALFLHSSQQRGACNTLGWQYAQKQNPTLIRCDSVVQWTLPKRRYAKEGFADENRFWHFAVEANILLHIREENRDVFVLLSRPANRSCTDDNRVCLTLPNRQWSSFKTALIRPVHCSYFFN